MASDAAKKKKKGSDSKYFNTTKKGEIAELKQDLNSLNKDKIKDAVKKVIANMTVGKDVSSLFTDVVKSMQTDNLELKKLVYLYIINYARSQPDKAILVVNTFCKDARDPSPIVRALAIRTMGCIRVDRITEYLCEPLRQALKDADPYVRKTAAVCTAKLYDINPELVEEQDFLERLRDMISDPNSMVVANAVAALAEISETSGKDVFQINSNVLNKLLAALNECTEWGRVFILDSLAQYNPTAKEAETIIERVAPQLQHANSAVAMSAIKVIMKYLDVVKNPALVTQVVNNKLPPPLITLLSEHKPEIQYVALRNINLIVQKRPEVLAKEVKHFFCKYNDPIYVKMEKLEIMIKLAAPDNIEQVLLELKEYATEVDVEFVRKSVRAIGRCAIKLDVAAERCIKVLLELIQTKVNYVVQEAIVVIKDIFRKYPNRYESIIATLCENLDTLDEPEAKASMIWIIGEYAARIENAPELLEGFVESFSDEPPLVQLQTLTATVKLFLRRPEDAKAMVTKVLNLATENSDNPDLRDRGYVYWRLLSTDPEAAQKVVLADKPVITDDTYQLDPSLLDTLIGQISTLASIYHKPPESFVQGAKSFKGFSATTDSKRERDADSDDEEKSGSGSGDEESGSGDEESGDEDDSKADTKETPSSPAKGPASAGAKAAPAVIDLFGFSADQPVVDMPTLNDPAPVVRRKVLINATDGKGFVLKSVFVRKDRQVMMDLEFENQTSQDLKTFAIKYKKNFYSASFPAGNVEVPTIRPGHSATAQVPVDVSAPVDQSLKVGPISMAIKTDVGVIYFEDTLPTYVMFQEDYLEDKKEYIAKWKDLGDDEQQLTFSDANTSDLKEIKRRFGLHNVFQVAKKTVPEKGEVLYCTVKIKNVDVLVELTVGSTVSGAAKSSDVMMAKAALYGIGELLRL